MKQDYVSHKGIVTAVRDGSLTLRAEEVGSCDGCAVAVICNKDKSGEGGTETITIDLPDALRFKVGDRVEAIASSGSTLRAALWALIVPTLIFIILVVGTRQIWPGLGSWSIAIGFGGLALYDLLLYLNRRRLASRLSWSVRLIENKKI